MRILEIPDVCLFSWTGTQGFIFYYSKSPGERYLLHSTAISTSFSDFGIFHSALSRGISFMQTKSEVSMERYLSLNKCYVLHK